MADVDLEQLVTDKVIRRCEPDLEAARRELQMARAHIESAATVAVDDPNAAFQLAYDGARKAVAAHMRARGCRVGSGMGAHAKTGRYALAVFRDQAVRPHVERFDDLRVVRNESEYDALLLDEADARDALVDADAIVTYVKRDLA